MGASLGVMGRLGARLETAGFAGVDLGSLFFFVSLFLSLDEGKGGGTERRGGAVTLLRGSLFAMLGPLFPPGCIYELRLVYKKALFLLEVNRQHRRKNQNEQE